MRGSTYVIWTVLEACQEEVLAHLSKPGVAFLATGLLELHEVDAFWYFRFEDELCPLDIWILLFDISLSFYFWNDDFFVVRIFLIWIGIAIKCFALCNRHVFPPLKWQNIAHIKRVVFFRTIAPHDEPLFNMAFPNGSKILVQKLLSRSWKQIAVNSTTVCFGVATFAWSLPPFILVSFYSISVIPPSKNWWCI